MARISTRFRTILTVAVVAAAFLGGVLIGPSVWTAIDALNAPRPDRLRLAMVDFAALPGWQQDPLTGFLPAFIRSCAIFAKLPDDREVGPDGRLGRASDWKDVCRDAATVHDEAQMRVFIETRFQPVSILNNDQPTGLFTGYYEPQLRGSLQRDATYTVPLYGVPDDLVMADLGAFRPSLRGVRIAGRVVGHRLRPAETRTEIERGAIDGKAVPLVWVDDPVDAFFLHIQGSGRVQLADGGTIRVGYAGQNGHAYAAIGKYMIEMGALTQSEVSMQTIRAWLDTNPDRVAEVFATNPSYIFFRKLDVSDPELGPPGAQGLPLTPGRSLAVDRRFHGLGIPVWLDASAPTGPDGAGELFRRLLVTQDTGGAITGPVRGDIFWGFGPRAAEIAGRMKHEGRMFLLLPRQVAERLN